MECDAPRDAIAVSWYQGSRILGTFKLSSQKGKNIDGLTPYDLNWEVDSEDLIRNVFKVIKLVTTAEFCHQNKDVANISVANFETYKAMTRRWNSIGCEVIRQEETIEGRDLTDTIRTGPNRKPIVCQTLTNIGDD